jgi:RNA polymerase sigma-70 factor (ECF subfamily)
MAGGMNETPDTGHENERLRVSGATVSMSDVDDWFVREVLPLEAVLTQFLHHNWRNKSEIPDLRQDIYMKVYQAAQKQLPDRVKPFLFATARNHLINRVRDENIVPIEAVADLDTLGIASEAPGPDRSVIARDALRRLQVALDRLPPRCREAVVLRKIEGLSVREIALRMGIAERTVKDHLTSGLRVLANTLYGDPADFRGQP